MATTRLTKENWISLGLEALRDHGPDALTVEEICEKARKTRGSFYFHFTAIDDFLQSLAESWLETFTHSFTKRPSPEAKRLDLLNQIAARLDIDLESQMRRLAARNENVQAIVHQADNARVKYLAELYAGTGKYDSGTSLALAKIEYAAFTGFRLIEPDMPASEARNLYENFLKLTSRA